MRARGGEEGSLERDLVVGVIWGGLGGFALSYNSRTGTDTRSELGARFDHAAWVTSDAALILRDQIVARAQRALAEMTDVRAMLDTSQTPPQ